MECIKIQQNRSGTLILFFAFNAKKNEIIIYTYT